jgi:putative membrane protein
LTGNFSLQVAFPYCLKDHLTRGGSIREELIGVLDQNEQEVLMGNKHKPYYVLQTMSEIVHNCKLSDMERAPLVSLQPLVAQFRI